MRILMLPVALALLLAGCAETDTPADVTPPMDVTPATVPDDVVFQGSMVGIGQVSAESPCAFGAEQCAEHTVVVPEGMWNVTFTLVGTDGTITSGGQPYPTDYDLFIEGVGESTNPGGEPDVVAKRLKAGSYVAEVVAWHDIDGSYTLTVTFAP